jgi:hypothetical protein
LTNFREFLFHALGCIRARDRAGAPKKSPALNNGASEYASGYSSASLAVASDALWRCVLATPIS